MEIIPTRKAFYYRYSFLLFVALFRFRVRKYQFDREKKYMIVVVFFFFFLVISFIHSAFSVLLVARQESIHFRFLEYARSHVE